MNYFVSLHRKSKKHCMRLKFLLPTLAAAVILTGCSGKGNDTAEQSAASTPSAAIADEGTIYGLACDGCNDTLVIFLPLPYDSSDPDTLNILEASRRHQVFGTPRIGDKLAMVRNTDDPTVADIVIVTEDLLGQWCYTVLPTLRQRADMEGQSGSLASEQLSDSIRELLSIEREYGIIIKNDSIAFTIGTRREATTDEESPVEYPQPRRYRQWYISNGQLVLTELMTDSLGNTLRGISDTATFVMLSADTLVLRFPDGERGYYFKEENLND